MRLISLVALLAAFLNLPSNTASQKSTTEQPDIGRSGTDFLRLCSNIENEADRSPLHISNDAMCLGWVEGFGDGFTVHDDLLGVPKKDRMVCMPHEVTTVQIVRAIKKYITDNPEKAHRATRLIASLALANAFPCKTRK
jgi:hypothetical protein